MCSVTLFGHWGLFGHLKWVKKKKKKEKRKNLGGLATPFGKPNL
jgi:hypothetical protein